VPFRAINLKAGPKVRTHFKFRKKHKKGARKENFKQNGKLLKKSFFFTSPKTPNTRACDVF